MSPGPEEHLQAPAVPHKATGNGAPSKQKFESVTTDKVDIPTEGGNYILEYARSTCKPAQQKNRLRRVRNSNS